MQRQPNEHNEPIETLDLKNGLTLQIVDGSGKVAADRWRVLIIARIDIPVDATWFSDTAEQTAPLEDMRRVLGDTVRYQYSNTRNFVDDREKAAVFDRMKTDIKANAEKYYGRRLFAARYIVKQYEDKLKSSHG